MLKLCAYLLCKPEDGYGVVIAVYHLAVRKTFVGVLQLHGVKVNIRVTVLYVLCRHHPATVSNHVEHLSNRIQNTYVNAYKKDIFVISRPS